MVDCRGRRRQVHSVACLSTELSSGVGGSPAEGDLTCRSPSLFYPRFTVLDAIGPYEVLRLLPRAEVTFVGEHPGRSPMTTAASIWSPMRRSATYQARTWCWCQAAGQNEQMANRPAPSRHMEPGHRQWRHRGWWSASEAGCAPSLPADGRETSIHSLWGATAAGLGVPALRPDRPTPDTHEFAGRGGL